MTEWKLRRDEREWPVKDAAELQQWANTGHVSPSDYIYNPTLEKWMYAREIAELSLPPDRRASSTGCSAAVACILLGVAAAVWAGMFGHTETQGCGMLLWVFAVALILGGVVAGVVALSRR
jgi:hypothetical protein